ncbi:MAG TPA: aldo/keto reductase [Kofleriaceae bacterium]|nr:aldo/keto reductase [Kofleriaceae bacterium]
MWTRRELLTVAGAALLARRSFAKPPAEDGPVTTNEPITRKIPSTGELLPAIGLGSYQTFDVDDASKTRPVLARFLELGGRVVDSSPMYGRAEAAIGEMTAAIAAADPKAPSPWLATKVWTSGKQQGIAQMKRSLERLRTKKLDLMQIHNLVDWKTQLATLRDWKAAGTIRYIGITHYSHGAFAELEQIVRKEKIDFVQLPYNVAERGAEKRLLPAAADAGVAVLVMEPFASGGLFPRVKGKPLPAVARELGCTSWAQLFLKFLLAHPAVTCPIPATAKLSHLEDNMAALRGAVPTAAQRDRIAAAI